MITLQKFNIPISIDISIKTHQFVCISWNWDTIWPLNQHYKLKNQRNWLEQVWVLNFWNVINSIFVHWMKKLTLAHRPPQASYVLYMPWSWIISKTSLFFCEVHVSLHLKAKSTLTNSIETFAVLEVCITHNMSSATHVVPPEWLENH